MAKKILFFTDNPVAGGGNKYFVDLIKAVAGDFEISILTNKNGFFETDRKHLPAQIEVNSTFIFRWKESANHRIKIFNYILDKVKDLFLPVFLVLNFFTFLIYISKRKPGLVVSSNGGYPAAESTLAMVLASRAANVPVVLTVVSTPGKRRKLLWLYDFLLDKLIGKASSAIVVNSATQKQALSETRGFSAQKITCIYNGIEDVKLQKNAAAGVQREKLTLGYVGRLDRLKGVDYVLRAIAQDKIRDKVRLVIVGEGPELKGLVKLSLSLNLNDRVEFKGFVNDSIANIHSEFDVFVFPSLWEGLPYSVLEAMRSGLPVVSTTVGGIPEAITHMESGILVTPGNADELCNAICLLSESNDLLETISKNARKCFEKEFTVDVMKKRFRHLTDQYLKNHN